MRLHLGTNGWLAVITGLVAIGWGGWGLSRYLFDVSSYGFIFLGFGLITFGITDGFNDESPRGRMLFKVGILIFILAALTLGYYFFRLI